MMAVIHAAGVGYLGPDGAGKATPMRCLLGMSVRRACGRPGNGTASDGLDGRGGSAC